VKPSFLATRRALVLLPLALVPSMAMTMTMGNGVLNSIQKFARTVENGLEDFNHPLGLRTPPIDPTPNKRTTSLRLGQSHLG